MFLETILEYGESVSWTAPNQRTAEQILSIENLISKFLSLFSSCTSDEGKTIEISHKKKKKIYEDNILCVH